MKFISLFSGIGGFDLAFENAGMECVALCEIDKNAQAVLRRRFPNAQLFDDVRKVGKETHGRKSVDLICGGFPCQDLSIAGKRAGLAGERSGLWFEFARIIDEIEPQWVVIENVPGLLSSNKGQDFAVILYWLVKRGYGVCWRVLDAQYFGVPQRRRRVFIVASFGNGRAAEILFERESGEGNTPPIAESQKSFTTTSGKSTYGTLTASQSKKQWLGNQEAFSGDFFVFSSKDDGRGIAKNISPTIQSQRTGMAIWEMQHAHEVYRESGSIAPTLQARMGTGGNQVPMVGVRRLMPIECERLQGFPDGWTDGQSDSTRYKQLGNAVAVPVVEWIGRRIKAVSDVPAQ